jgi:hypothetical protein
VRRAMTLLAVLAITLLAGAATASAKIHKEVRYVRLVVESGFFVQSGQSGGDLFGSTGTLRHDGADVGTFSAACTSTASDAGECQTTLRFKSGNRLQLAGNIYMQRLKNRLSIVGGSGRYRRARGDATLTRVDDQGQVQKVKLRILGRLG